MTGFRHGLISRSRAGERLWQTGFEIASVISEVRLADGDDLIASFVQTARWCWWRWWWRWPNFLHRNLNNVCTPVLWAKFAGFTCVNKKKRFRSRGFECFSQAHAYRTLYAMIIMSTNRQENLGLYPAKIRRNDLWKSVLLYLVSLYSFGIYNLPIWCV